MCVLFAIMLAIPGVNEPGYMHARGEFDASALASVAAMCVLFAIMFAIPGVNEPGYMYARGEFNN